MKVITLYVCETCGQEYETADQAAQCESRPKDPELFAIGDVVVVDHYAFGWFDGDRAWVENFDDCERDTRLKKCEQRFCRKCCYRFYYVVTFVDRDDRDPHRVRYHLATRAMIERGYQSGWTFNTGHFKPSKVVRPPAAVASGARALAWSKTTRLLMA